MEGVGVSNTISMFCLCSLKYESQLSDEYKAKLNRECWCCLNELQKPAAASIQKTETETESNGIKLVATCINDGMWLEAHDPALLLPIKSVTNLDYRMHLRRQRILTPLQAGGAELEHRQNPLPQNMVP